MLSILIPIYNHNAKLLVCELHKQAILLDVPFEIILIDDASTEVFPDNYLLNQLSFCSILTLTENIGRSKIRNLLVSKANFDWILFLDCDCFPDSDSFLQNYLKEIYAANQKVIFGGWSKIDQIPDLSYSLRYKFNNFREVRPVDFRKKYPYQSVYISNILIHKSLFNTFSFNEEIHKYGYEDYLFFRQLEKKKIPIKHIDNTIKHLSIDHNILFLEKTIESIEMLSELVKTNKSLMRNNKIFMVYKWLKKWKLLPLYKLFFKANKSIFEKNLISNNPYLLVFDLYKLGLFCQHYKR